MNTPLDTRLVRSVALLFLDVALLAALLYVALAHGTSDTGAVVFGIALAVLVLGIFLSVLFLPSGRAAEAGAIDALVRVVTLTSLVGLLALTTLSVMTLHRRNRRQDERVAAVAPSDAEAGASAETPSDAQGLERLSAWLDWLEKRTQVLAEDGQVHAILAGYEVAIRESLEPEALAYLDELYRLRESARVSAPDGSEPASSELASRRKQIEDHLEVLAEGGLIDRLLLLIQNLPDLQTARLSANRASAIATLRNLTSAQAQLQALGRLDADRDGVGEFGGLLELAGDRSERLSAPLDPPVLGPAFKALNDRGCFLRNGYYFRIYLPDAQAAGVAEAEDGFGTASNIDADRSETLWCAYAWPASNVDGNTDTFFVNQVGDVLMAQTEDYGGPRRVPPANAAFLSPNMAGDFAVEAKGQDGNLWRQVN